MKTLRKYQHKASTRDYLISLAYFPNFIKLLDTNNKSYKALADWLVTNGKFIRNDEIKLPTIKEISSLLGIDQTKLTKYFKLIYDDIFELNLSQPHLFKREGQILCYMSFTYFEQCCTFSIGMDAVPRIGEHLEFFFIRAKLGCSGYYIHNLYHDIECTGHSVMISFSAEAPNNYFNLLKEKAYLNNAISFRDLINKESELKETLIRLYRNL
jgi:hypothetical protein